MWGGEAERKGVKRKRVGCWRGRGTGGEEGEEKGDIMLNPRKFIS